MKLQTFRLLRTLSRKLHLFRSSASEMKIFRTPGPNMQSFRSTFSGRPFFRAMGVSILTAASLMVTSCGEETAKAEPDKQDTAAAPAILFLGDSLTAGLGLEKFQAAPALIQEKIDQEGWNLKVINAGVSGDTTSGGLSRLDWYLRKENQIEYLVIGLGSNDGMRGLSISDMRRNIVDIVERTRKFNPQVEIFIYELQTFPSMGPDYAKKFQAAFPELADELDLHLIAFPLKGVAGEDDLNQDDGIHPNVKGTQIMAENIWRSIRPVLARSQDQ